MSENHLMQGTLVGGVLSVLLYSWYRSRNSVPLPPGPKGHLIFGSVQNADAFWLKFTEYNDKYGPLVSVRMLHQYTILISDPQLASELFEKRAANYSDKRTNTMAKLIGWGQSIVFLPYGPLMKRSRAMLHRTLSSRVSPDYIPLQQHEALRFMRRLLEQPDRFMEHVHLMAASIAIRITYGYKVDSADDRFVRIAEEMMAAFSDVSVPVRWAVNVLPILRYVPAWFPFFTFHQRAQQVRRIRETAENEPFQYVEQQVAEGIAEDSFTSKLLQSDDGKHVGNDTKELIKSIASTLYGAGSDTTVSAIQTFFLAMTLYPDVQEKAQAEISAYTKQRSASDNPSMMILPADRENLPYTSALVREVLRWHPISNAVAHQLGAQDDYNVVSGGTAYRIPAGSAITVNVWKISHDPQVYPEPDRFKPERFLVDNPPLEPERYAFGFGRRMCPGIHVAQQSMWISISNVLANFKITKSKDENGRDITPEEQYTNGIICHPMPFKCSITPREGCAARLREMSE